MLFIRRTFFLRKGTVYNSTITGISCTFSSCYKLKRADWKSRREWTSSLEKNDTKLLVIMIRMTSIRYKWTARATQVEGYLPRNNLIFQKRSNDQYDCWKSEIRKKKFPSTYQSLSVSNKLAFSWTHHFNIMQYSIYHGSFKIRILRWNQYIRVILKCLFL